MPGGKFRLAYAVLIVLLFIISIVVWFKHDERLHSEYPLIKRSDQIFDEVISLYKSKGGVFMTTSSGKFFIGLSQNHNYDEILLYDNIFVGDSIIKRSGSDTIHILRQDKKLIFLYNDEIPKQEPDARQ